MTFFLPSYHYFAGIAIGVIDQSERVLWASVIRIGDRLHIDASPAVLNPSAGIKFKTDEPDAYRSKLPFTGITMTAIR